MIPTRYRRLHGTPIVAWLTAWVVGATAAGRGMEKTGFTSREKMNFGKEMVILLH